MLSRAVVLLQIVKEKDRFRKAPSNYAMKKTQLMKEKVGGNVWVVFNY